MPLAAKVNSFEREIGGDEEIESMSNPLDSTIISDAGNQRSARTRLPSDAGDQIFLGKRHAIQYTDSPKIAEKRGETPLNFRFSTRARGANGFG
jgi:hypothetical protein